MRNCRQLVLIYISNYYLNMYYYIDYNNQNLLQKMDKDNTIKNIEDQLNKFIKSKIIVPKQLIELIKNETRWNLSTRKYTQLHLEAVFEQIKKPKNLSFLWLYWNYFENICKIVILPEYSQLKILNLGGNNIVSVQPLQHANMPTLQELWLWHNRLTRVNSIRKMYVPNLKYIDLSSNFITECQKVSELHSIKLQIISVQHNGGMGCIDYFAKLLGGNGTKIIKFQESNIVSVMGIRGKKGTKHANTYKFPSQKIEYK